ncbi:P-HYDROXYBENZOIC ACID EFFLUX PUMP SUBUNIT-RELATED [Salix koriyanagi]|uniref:p-HYDROXYBENZOIC ACID EFFLUX PUMP SUBUNIT-RELATED n=1 Tax=Salix koriyanagi TaxID=2511006 RepID=A0A9Q0VEB4_9ROSI|nr:P-HYDROXYBENZOIC ACID EFFLUX PUMP SUBUNIT-RELATED [Salix koriyanagi]
MVEILWRPARAATLAKTELAGSLSALRDCINDISHLGAGQKSVLSSSIPALRRKHQEVKSRISNLEKFIAEAEAEPNFWFLPFYGACYRRLLVSLRKMEHLLLFVAFEIETLSQVSDRLQELINSIYLHPLAAAVGFSLNSIGELISISSLRKISISDRDEIDELGKSSPSADVVFWTFILDGEIENSNEEADEIEKRKGAQELKSRLILCIYSLEFCITSLIKETREIEKHVKELVAWENP